MTHQPDRRRPHATPSVQTADRPDASSPRAPEPLPWNLIRQDARFALLVVLEARGVLNAVVQDSANLQWAPLQVRVGARSYTGMPGQTDLGVLGLDETRLDGRLGLDLLSAATRACGVEELREEVATWTAGMVYAFSAGTDGPVVRRVFNLGVFADRVEFEWAAMGGLAPFDLVRAHRLGGAGRSEVWRAERQPGVAPAPRGRRYVEGFI